VRTAVAVSVVAHGAVLASLLLFAGPKPYDSGPWDAVSVDLVSPEEVGAPAAGEPPAIAKPAPTPPPASSLALQVPHHRPPAVPSPQSAAEPQLLPAPPHSVFDAASIPALLDLVPPAVSSGLVPPAEVPAQLFRAEIAALKAHLDRCWKLSAAIAQGPRLKAVIRVFLKPDGALAASPVLLEASASPDGPALVAAATQALRRCQPYRFLPADRYREWKVLDLTFSPHGLSG
jgi:hypothetical protein